MGNLMCRKSPRVQLYKYFCECGTAGNTMYVYEVDLGTVYHYTYLTAYRIRVLRMFVVVPCSY